jgi:hypothetical protein
MSASEEAMKEATLRSSHTPAWIPRNIKTALDAAGGHWHVVQLARMFLIVKSIEIPPATDLEPFKNHLERYAEKNDTSDKSVMVQELFEQRRLLRATLFYAGTNLTQKIFENASDEDIATVSPIIDADMRIYLILPKMDDDVLEQLKKTKPDYFRLFKLKQNGVSIGENIFMSTRAGVMIEKFFPEPYDVPMVGICMDLEKEPEKNPNQKSLALVGAEGEEADTQMKE